MDHAVVWPAHVTVMNTEFDILDFGDERPTAQFGLLLLEPDESLTDDQCESLAYYKASGEVICGSKLTNSARRWYDKSMQVARIARTLGRLPELSDPGVTAVLARWIDQQRAAELNSFQRARLAEIVGWEDTSG